MTDVLHKTKPPDPFGLESNVINMEIKADVSMMENTPNNKEIKKNIKSNKQMEVIKSASITHKDHIMVIYFLFCFS